MRRGLIEHFLALYQGVAGRPRMADACTYCNTRMCVARLEEDREEGDFGRRGQRAERMASASGGSTGWSDFAAHVAAWGPGLAGAFLL
jgi:hypothetical protein